MVDLMRGNLCSTRGFAARVCFVVASLVMATTFTISSADASTAHTYPLGNAKLCSIGYVKRTESHVVNGVEVRYVACVFTTQGYHLSVSIRDLDSEGDYLVGDRIVVSVTAYFGARRVTTGAYNVDTPAPTENAGFCGIGIFGESASPVGQCELIFSQPGDFSVTESYGYGPYASLAKASQVVSIYQP
jgi:hypothetical protein